MKIAEPNITRTCPERDIWNELLQLDGKAMLELGCGKAEITRILATEGPGRSIKALEVDTIQHHRHLTIDDLPNVEFVMAGAEDIPFEGESFDVAFMFKSLHHVPLELMDQTLQEIRRVLKPGGLAYISEPIFAGDFNEVLRMFHDEQAVRLAAFEAVQRAVDDNVLALEKEVFFHSPMRFENFADFEEKILRVTHSNHQLSDELYQQVKTKFESHMSPEGANFLMPIRIDLLKKEN